jgi:signal peptidase II
MNSKNTILFFIVLICDRITKYWAYHYLEHGFNVSSFLSFNLTFNRGIACGIFNVPDEMIFWSVNCFVITLYCAFAFFFYQRMHAALELIGATFILAGGISNILDRFLYHGVIDFIIFSIGFWSCPAFNIADAAIMFGVMLIGYLWLNE